MKERLATIAAITAAGAGVASMPSVAVASPVRSPEARAAQAQNPNNQITSEEMSQSLSGFGLQADSAEALTQDTWLSYVKAHGMSQKQISHAKKLGECAHFGKGTDNPTYWNTGRSINGGMVTFKDNTYIYACKDGKGVYREIEKNGKPHNCWNQITPEKPKLPVVHGHVFQVENFGSKTLRLRAKANAVASAACRLTTSNGEVSASGYGSGHAEVDEKISLRLVAKSKGAAAIKEFVRIKGAAEASAMAAASANCESTPPQNNQTPPPPQNQQPQCTVRAIEQKGDGRSWRFDIIDNMNQVSDDIKFGDGSEDTGVADTFVHTYGADGTEQVVFSGQDEQGNVETCATQITVQQHAGTPPPPPAAANV